LGLLCHLSCIVRFLRGATLKGLCPGFTGTEIACVRDAVVISVRLRLDRLGDWRRGRLGSAYCRILTRVGDILNIVKDSVDFTGFFVSLRMTDSRNHGFLEVPACRFHAERTGSHSDIVFCAGRIARCGCIVDFKEEALMKHFIRVTFCAALAAMIFSFGCTGGVERTGGETAATPLVTEGSAVPASPASPGDVATTSSGGTSEGAAPIVALKRLEIKYYQPEEITLTALFTYSTEGRITAIDESHESPSTGKQLLHQEFTCADKEITVTAGDGVRKIVRDADGRTSSIVLFSKNGPPPMQKLGEFRRPMAFDATSGTWVGTVDYYDGTGQKVSSQSALFDERGLPLVRDPGEGKREFFYVKETGALHEIKDLTLGGEMEKQALFEYAGGVPVRATSREFDPLTKTPYTQVICTPTLQDGRVVKEELRFTNDQTSEKDVLIESHIFEYVTLDKGAKPPLPLELMLASFPALPEPFFKAELTLLFADRPTMFFLGP
jgi:hypothetical protein